MKALVSIIVPVYQVEQYLARCLDSLLAQTYRPLEIVVVEDGSKDGSKAIVEQYVAKHPDLIVPVYQSNQGLSAARNHGIQASKGDFLVFVDSDDFVASDMIATMVDDMQDDVSIVETTAYFAYDDKSVKVKTYQTKKSITKQDLAKDKGTLLQLALTAHSKMYRRELVEKVMFPVGLVHEDVYFTQMLYPYIISVVKSNHGGYYHYQRHDSITNTYNLRIYDMLEVQKRVCQAYQDNGLFDTYQPVLERNAIRTLVLSTIGRKMGCLRAEFHKSRKTYYDQIVAFIVTNYPQYQTNPYLSRTEKGMAYILLTNYATVRFLWRFVSKVVRR